MCRLFTFTTRALRSCLNLSIDCCQVITRLPMGRPIRVILSLLMILVLLITWTICPLSYSRAILSEITVIGGGALTLAALLDLLMVTFGAAGMDGAVRNQAAATGTQTVPYIGQLLNRYLGVVLDGIAPATWAQPIQDGLSVLPNGTLYLDSDATAAIADFQRWSWDVDGANLQQFAPTVSGNGDLIYGDLRAVRFDCTQEVSTGFFIDPRILWTYSDGQYGYVIVSKDKPTVAYALFMRRPNNPDTCTVWVALPNTGVSAIRNIAVSTGVLGSGGSYFTAMDPDVFVSMLGTNVSHIASYPVYDYRDLPSLSDFVPVDVAAGDPDTFVGPMQQGQGTQLPLGDVVTVSSDAAANLHLLNYLRAASAAYAGSGTAEVPVTDVGTGEDQLLPLSVPLDNPIGVTGLTDAAIDQTGAAAGTDAISGDFAGTDAYTMDLTQFFPFCIPFDLYALYQKFESGAAAPVIDWPIPMPGGGDPLLVHLDFSVFDGLAVWVRRLELIAFAVGLMIMTKQLIQGGD